MQYVRPREFRNRNMACGYIKYTVLTRAIIHQSSFLSFHSGCCCGCSFLRPIQQSSPQLAANLQIILLSSFFFFFLFILLLLLLLPLNSSSSSSSPSLLTLPPFSCHARLLHIEKDFFICAIDCN